MRIAVFGTGAVGGYFGARLALAGHDVFFIARGAHLQAIRSHGLKVESILGTFSLNAAQATDDPAEVGPVDVVLVGVKAWQVPEAAEQMRPLVGEDTLVVPLQNGVDAPAQLGSVLDRPGAQPNVIGGLCRIVSMIAAPGVIKHGGMDPYIAFNRLDGALDERVSMLSAAFAYAGVTCEVPADINAALWAKFAFIAGFGGVGAVTRVPAGALRAIPETRAMLETAIREVEVVARARGITLPVDIVARTLAMVDNLPPGGTASMQRDIMAGRPSELESQTGALVRLGKEAGVATPVHAFIYASLLPQETAARG